MKRTIHLIEGTLLFIFTSKQTSIWSQVKERFREIQKWPWSATIRCGIESIGMRKRNRTGFTFHPNYQPCISYVSLEIKFQIDENPRIDSKPYEYLMEASL